MGTFVLNGKLVDCQRTPEGIRAVSMGQVMLNMRERHFWLLVDKTDDLNQKICERIVKNIDLTRFINENLITVRSVGTVHLSDLHPTQQTVSEIIEERHLIEMAATLHARASQQSLMA